MTTGERQNLFLHLLARARGLNPVAEDGQCNPEYVRGQAELICEATGLHTDHKELVQAAICTDDVHTGTLLGLFLRTTADGVSLDSSQERPYWPGRGWCGECDIRSPHKPADCGKYVRS